MADQRRGRDDSGAAGASRERNGGPTDAGRTMGGGSLGHAPADDVTSETDLRNNPPGESADAGRVRQHREDREQNAADEMATGSDEDPVMPSDDATLKTKI